MPFSLHGTRKKWLIAGAFAIDCVSLPNGLPQGQKWIASLPVANFKSFAFHVLTKTKGRRDVRVLFSTRDEPQSELLHFKPQVIIGRDIKGLSDNFGPSAEGTWTLDRRTDKWENHGMTLTSGSWI